MSKPRLLDLFCGAGGAAMGYSRAGFEVVGVDINPQPHYPFEFIRQDAMVVLDGITRGQWGDHFQAIHASPPCQGYSHGARSDAAKAIPQLIEPVRARLKTIGLPYVIENVRGASDALRVTPQGYIVMCGRMFGTDRPVRHRLFEVDPFIWQPHHPKCKGQNARLAAKLGVDWRRVQVVGHGNGPTNRQMWRDLLGMQWAQTDHELTEAIPPAYTEWIGAQLLASLRAVA